MHINPFPKRLVVRFTAHLSAKRRRIIGIREPLHGVFFVFAVIPKPQGRTEQTFAELVILIENVPQVFVAFPHILNARGFRQFKDFCTRLPAGCFGKHPERQIDVDR